MKVKFVVRDILETPYKTYIATTVAADFKMSGGVAKQIKYCYGLDDVEFHADNPNGDCVLYDHLLFLVDKPNQRSRVTTDNLKAAFVRLKEIVKENGITKIAMPMVGTGCDKLNWDNDVFPIFTEVFDDTDIEFEICVLSEDNVRDDYNSTTNVDDTIIHSMVNAMVDGCNKTDIVFGAAKEMVNERGIPIRDAFDRVDELFEKAVERYTGVSKKDLYETTSSSSASSHYTTNGTTADKQFMDLINKITK